MERYWMWWHDARSAGSVDKRLCDTSSSVSRVNLPRITDANLIVLNSDFGRGQGTEEVVREAQPFERRARVHVRAHVSEQVV